MAKKQPKRNIIIAEVRRTAGLNQSEFWGRIGVTQSGGSRYETGRPMPKPVAMLFDLVYIRNAVDAAEALSDLRINK